MTASHSSESRAQAVSLRQRLVAEGVRNPPLGELAVNRYIVRQLKRVLASKGLQINSLTSDLSVTRSSSSKVDLAIFHEAKFIVHEKLRGVAVQQATEANEQSDASTCLYGEAGEFKPIDRTIAQEIADKKQLVENMGAVGGELALMACRMGKVFNMIVMYGVLVDTEGHARVARLTMDFLTTTTQLEWSKENTLFNIVMESLCSVLGCDSS